MLLERRSRVLYKLQNFKRSEENKERNGRRLKNRKDWRISIMKRLLLFWIALGIFIGTVFIGGDNIISALILLVCLIVMILTVEKEVEYCKKYKTVKEIKREIEEDSELFATGIGILIILGIYFIGMLLPYFIH